MTELSSSLYLGQVVHRRYQPLHHELRYKVANVMVDVDALPVISRKLWLFAYNRFSLFSIHDTHHGPGDGTPIAQHVRGLMDQLETTQPVGRIFMFCYPAVLGYVFNPISVYFGLDGEGRILAIVYEVNNTFGQRHSYAIATDGATAHTIEKQFYVSPFNPAEGEYRFRVDLIDDRLRLNIALFEKSTFKLCARFEGRRAELSNSLLAANLVQILVQPLKVIAGIHWEALKLYLKGLRTTLRPEHAKHHATVSRKIQ